MLLRLNQSMKQEKLENDSEEAHALSYDEVKEKMDDSDDSKE